MEGEIPKVGGAEKLKLQEAIPPFSLIEDSIHGKNAETLVKTAKSCCLQLSPSLLLTIPTRMWEPSSFTTVSGPPLSPLVKKYNNQMTWFDDPPCRVRLQHPLRTQSGLRPHLQSGSSSQYSCCPGRSILQSLAACRWKSLELLQCLPSLRLR